MLSNTFTMHNMSATTSTKISGTFIGVKGITSFDRSKESSTPGVGSFVEKLCAERILEESATVISGARKRGTNYC